MIKVTNREIAAIAAATVIGIALTALAMTGFNAALAAKLIAERASEGATSGIIAAIIIVPAAIAIRHAIVLPAYDMDVTSSATVSTVSTER